MGVSALLCAPGSRHRCPVGVQVCVLNSHRRTAKDDEVATRGVASALLHYRPPPDLHQALPMARAHAFSRIAASVAERYPEVRGWLIRFNRALGRVS